MSKRALKVVPRTQTEHPETRRGPSEAKLVGLSAEGAVLVRLAPGAPPVVAALATSCSDRALLLAIRQEARVLVDFLDADPKRPVIVGLLRDRLAIDEGPLAEACPPTLVLEAKDSILLGCGASSIELSSNGRVAIKGDYVVTSATGPLALHGASVRVN